MPLWKQKQANNPHHKRPIGAHYEALACQFLVGQGLIFLEQNFQCRRGELDLIMQDRRQQFVFVEVKFRRNNRFGGAQYALDQRKQHRLVITAQHWLQLRGYDAQNTSYRFDYVAIDGHEHIDWMTNVIAED